MLPWSPELTGSFVQLDGQRCYQQLAVTQDQTSTNLSTFLSKSEFFHLPLNDYVI